jgi:hypothetical protein
LGDAPFEPLGSDIPFGHLKNRDHGFWDISGVTQ